MAKFFSILAASVGGGLVLGASIRLGEAIGSSAIGALGHAPVGISDANLPSVRLPDARVAVDPLVIARTPESAAASEVSSPATDWQAAISGVVARIDHQQSEVETMRQQMTRATKAMDSVSAIAVELRSELHRTIGQDLDRRLTAIEEGFQVSMEAANRETADAMVASIETRIAPRISRLEADLAGQTSAVSELRECALQSERSIQRLLGVLEKVMNPTGQAAAHALFVARGSKNPDEAAGGSGGLRRASAFRPLNPVI